MPLLRVPLRPFRHRNVQPAASGYRRKQSEKLELVMKSLLPARFHDYDFSPMFVTAGFTLAIAIIVYGSFFGRIL